MAALSDNAVAWTYTVRTGVTYRLRAKKEMVDQQTAGLAVKVGGSAADETVQLPTIGFKPRKVYCVGNTDKSLRRAVVCYTPDAPLLTPGTLITLRHLGADVVFKSTSGVLDQKVRAGILNDA